MLLTEEQRIVLEELQRLLENAQIVLTSTMSSVQKSLAIARAINKAWSGAEHSRIIEASVDPQKGEVVVGHLFNPNSKGIDTTRLPISLLIHTKDQAH